MVATKIATGTDVNFGDLSRNLLGWLRRQQGSGIESGYRGTQPGLFHQENPILQLIVIVAGWPESLNNVQSLFNSYD
jgi:hypothetical protein